MSMKLKYSVCCGLDVHKKVIVATIVTTNKDGISEYNQKTGFKRVSDDKPVDITQLSEDDTGLYYKDEPYTTKKLHQRLIITYSPKYALYQKGSVKKERRNPNDPARFIGSIAVTEDGETAGIQRYPDEDKINLETQYDGLYAVCTDLLDDDVCDILKVSEGRWQIEECFRIMKTDFSARPVYLHNESRIKAHFLICFLSLLVYRLLERKLEYKYTCETLLNTLKGINFAEIQEQGFMPLYRREKSQMIYMTLVVFARTINS